MTGYSKGTATAAAKKSREWPLLEHCLGAASGDARAQDSLKRAAEQDEARKKARQATLTKLKEKQDEIEAEKREEKEKQEEMQKKRDETMKSYVEAVKGGLSELKEAMKHKAELLSKDTKAAQEKSEISLQQLAAVGEALVEEQKSSNKPFEKVIDNL